MTEEEGSATTANPIVAVAETVQIASPATADAMTTSTGSSKPPETRVDDEKAKVEVPTEADAGPDPTTTTESLVVDKTTTETTTAEIITKKEDDDEKQENAAPVTTATETPSPQVDTKKKEEEPVAVVSSEEASSASNPLVVVETTNNATDTGSSTRKEENKEEEKKEAASAPETTVTQPSSPELDTKEEPVVVVSEDGASSSEPLVVETTSTKTDTGSSKKEDEKEEDSTSPRTVVTPKDAKGEQAEESRPIVQPTETSVAISQDDPTATKVESKQETPDAVGETSCEQTDVTQQAPSNPVAIKESSEETTTDSATANVEATTTKDTDAVESDKEKKDVIPPVANESPPEPENTDKTKEEENSKQADTVRKPDPPTASPTPTKKLAIPAAFESSGAKESDKQPETFSSPSKKKLAIPAAFAGTKANVSSSSGGDTGPSSESGASLAALLSPVKRPTKKLAIPAAFAGNGTPGTSTSEGHAPHAGELAGVPHKKVSSSPFTYSEKAAATVVNSNDDPTDAPVTPKKKLAIPAAFAGDKSGVDHPPMSEKQNPIVSPAKKLAIPSAFAGGGVSKSPEPEWRKSPSKKLAVPAVFTQASTEKKEAKSSPVPQKEALAPAAAVGGAASAVDAPPVDVTDDSPSAEKKATGKAESAEAQSKLVEAESSKKSLSEEKEQTKGLDAPIDNGTPGPQKDGTEQATATTSTTPKGDGVMPGTADLDETQAANASCCTIL